MNVFGIGFPELIFIFVIALIVLGPKNMIKASQQLSTAIRKLVTSDTWKTLVHSTKEIRDIQGQIIEDSGLQDSLNSLRNSTRDLVNPSIKNWTPPKTNLTVPPDIEVIPPPVTQQQLLDPQANPDSSSTKESADKIISPDQH